jgi:general stress protein 26
MLNWVEAVRPRLIAEFGDNGWVCVLATCNDRGEPTARCMVLRDIDRSGQLWFVSDRRTRKDDHIRTNPATEVCLWLPKELVQIRISGRATAMDATTDQFFRQSWWEKLSDENRQIFGAAPGDEDAPMPATFELISITPVEIELQDLKAKGNQKRVWRASSTGQFSGIM